MKKTILTSIAAIAFAVPAIAANIPNNATCNSGVLGVSSGSANLEADYTANTINITWDGNGGSTPTGGASSCTYDSTFNLPAAPTKTGYTFAGWAVAAQSCFANLPTAVLNSDDLWGESNQSYGQNGTWQAEFATGHYVGEDLMDSVIDEIYGIVTGISKCSSTSGSFATAGTPSDTNGRHCWCQVSAYTPNGGTQCNVASPFWIYASSYAYINLADGDDDMNCADSCSADCTFFVHTSSDFRRALLGLN